MPVFSFVSIESNLKRKGLARTPGGIVLNKDETLPRDEARLGRSRYFGLVENGAYEDEVAELCRVSDLVKRERVRPPPPHLIS